MFLLLESVLYPGEIKIGGLWCEASSASPAPKNVSKTVSQSTGLEWWYLFVILAM
jgi:hypothetical protein